LKSVKKARTLAEPGGGKGGGVGKSRMKTTRGEKKKERETWLSKSESGGRGTKGTESPKPILGKDVKPACLQRKPKEGGHGAKEEKSAKV